MTIFCLILAGVLNAVMDKLVAHYDRSIFSNLNPMFWDFNKSWRNKWKNGEKAQGERFFLSSTVLVFLTDGWHLAKTLMLAHIYLAIINYEVIVNPVLDFFIFWTVFGVTFEACFTYLFERSFYDKNN